MASSTPTSLDVLLVEDEPELRQTIADVLVEAGYAVVVASDGTKALHEVLCRRFDVVLCDVRLPGIDGLELFRRVRRESPTTNVILMTAFAEVTHAVAALKEGAYDYITKPFELEELVLQLGRLASRRSLEHELEEARVELGSNRPQSTIIGQSLPMRRILDMLEMVARSDAAVLITGESGTGKELAARMIHDRSSRHDKPFVAVNCGALAENLIEAELFGHERGAFTGAERKRDGRFKAADGGTIFLDEIAELPQAAQAKLLRVLQEGTFEPLGSNVSLKVDVRIVAATHRNLRERIDQNLFREDLFYRVNVIEVPLPPLRERRGDLTLLVQHYLQRFTPKGQPLASLTPAAWAALSQYRFPGNVRELSHAIQHAVVLSGGREIEVHHLPVSIAAQSPLGGGVAVESTGLAGTQPLAAAVRAFEREYLIRVVAQAGGRKTQAAETLGISRKTLWEKLKTYGASPEELGKE